jgi:hypothetical protein
LHGRTSCLAVASYGNQAKFCMAATADWHHNTSRVGLTV